MMRGRALAALAVAPLAIACSDPQLLPGTLSFTTGLETDAWTRAPAPTKLEVRQLTASQTTVLASTPLPADTFDLADLDPNAIASFEAAALDDGGETLLRGRTVAFSGYDLAGSTAPVFVGRTGEWARPAGPLVNAHVHAPAAVVLDRYLFSAGGTVVGSAADPGVPELYDLGGWTGFPNQPALPRTPRTMAGFQSMLLLIDDAGASWYDVGYDEYGVASAPTGLDFKEIVGGDPVTSADGTLYVVGATRTTGLPTQKILRIAGDGKTASVMTLLTPRLGAAAAYVEGQGLVVAGGSATGAGVEVAASDAFVALGYGADPTVGAAIASTGDHAALLVGGEDPTTKAPAAARAIDLTCATACPITALTGSSPSFASARAFAYGSGQVLAIGDAPDGQTRAYTVTASPGSMAEVPLKEPRSGATAILLPTGVVAVVGGQLAAGGAALHLEIFTP